MLQNNLLAASLLKNSKYPFTELSTLQVNNNKLPAGMIKHITINTDAGATMPVHFLLLLRYGQRLRIWLYDSSYKAVGFFFIYKDSTSNSCSDFIFSPYCSVIGSLSYGKLLAAYFYGLLLNHELQSIKIASNAFMLLPSCCFPYNKKGLHSFLMGNNIITENVYIKPAEDTTITTTLTDTNISMNVSGDSDMLLPDVTTSMLDGDVTYVGGLQAIQCGDVTVNASQSLQHILIRSGAMSNIRVMMLEGASQIALTGVQDVQ